MNIERFEQQSKEKQAAVLAAGVEEFSLKSYSDASTDAIVQRCGISKGLLFHYFGSKKEFYCYCLSQALDKLIEHPGKVRGSFYDILFSVMDQKLQRCAQYPAETRFVNMASRDEAGEVAKDKKKIFMKYFSQVHTESTATMDQALAALPVKAQDSDRIKDGLLLYSKAIINKYLLIYQNTPEEFFKRAPQIKAEFKEYIDMMLFGIIEERSK